MSARWFGVTRPNIRAGSAVSLPGSPWRPCFHDVARHDGAPLVYLDSTGADILVGVAEELQPRSVRLAIAGVLPQVRLMLERSGALERLGREAVPETLRAAVDAHEIRAKRLDQVVPVR